MQRQIWRKLGYFQVNYALIILGIIFLSLLWHPISVIVFIIMFVAWGFCCFAIDEPLVVFGRTLKEELVIGVFSVVKFMALMLIHATMAFLIGLLIALYSLESILRDLGIYYKDGNKPVIVRDLFVS